MHNLFCDWVSHTFVACMVHYVLRPRKRCDWSIQYKSKSVFHLKYELRLKEQNVHPTYNKTWQIFLNLGTKTKNLDTRLPFFSVCLCHKMNELKTSHHFWRWYYVPVCALSHVCTILCLTNHKLFRYTENILPKWYLFLQF